MELPEDLRYTREHEWISLQGEVATVGITDHAQEQLGDVVYVELPGVGDAVAKTEAFGVVESTKAVSDVYAPVSGEVVEVNDDLTDNPELVNEDPYGDGWLVKIRVSDASELGDLLSADEYRAFLEAPEEE